MALQDLYLGDFTQLFWILSLLLILSLAWYRFRDQIGPKWDHQVRIRTQHRRPVFMTILRLYSSTISSTPQELASTVRDEIIRNAAFVYGKPPTFFLKYRDQPTVLKQYFFDDELVSFIFSPKLWAAQNGDRRGLLGFSVSSKTTPRFLRNLERILNKFEKQVLPLSALD